MGNSLDCGLGDCGSPDDAESSDYSKPVEYDQVRRRSFPFRVRRSPRPPRGSGAGSRGRRAAGTRGAPPRRARPPAARSGSRARRAASAAPTARTSGPRARAAPPPTP